MISLPLGASYGSLSIALSSIVSAKRFFSLVFSSSSARKRCPDPVLAAHIGGLRFGFLLPQDPDDPLFREKTWLHVHPPAGDGLYPFLEEITGLIPIR